MSGAEEYRAHALTQSGLGLHHHDSLLWGLIL